MPDDRLRRLAAIAALLAAGVFAGAQLGKIAPLALWYRDGLGLSLVAIGWLTSAIGAFVAAFALPAGWAVGAAGLKRSFAASSLLLAAGGLALALLTAPAALLAARLVEGAAYLVLVIALPALLAEIALPRWRGAVLALWGGFVPAGFAAADLLAGLVLPAAGPSAFLLAVVLAFCGFAAAGWALLGRIGDRAPAAARGGAAPIGATLTPSIAVVALAFGVYVVQSVGFFAFFPAFAAARGDLLVGAAPVAALVIAGNLLAGMLVGRAGARGIATLAAAGFGVSAAAALAAFAGLGPAAASAGAVLFAVAGGVVSSTLFAIIPGLVPPRGAAAVAIGLVAQAGGIGTLVGPPLAGYVIERAGWPGFGWFVAATGAAGVVALVPLLAARRRMAA